MSATRVRFAPSPTGYLHIGGLRTALFNFLFARHTGGVFILRIEDTDRTRLVPGATENIISILSWAGITPDEGPRLDPDGGISQKGDFGPYIQSERTAIYRRHVEQLLAGGHAYRCFCSPQRLETVRAELTAKGSPVRYDGACRCIPAAESDRRAAAETHTIRLRVPEGAIVFRDAIRGEVSFDSTQVDDQVLLKSDGFPTYHLANVVDDHHMGITHVIRGEEWLSSTPKHLLLYAAFGWQPPVFAHLPLLLNPDRSKLSKRSGDVSVEDFRAEGYLPDALVNYVALLGWSTEDSQQLFTRADLIAKFSLERCSQSPAVFDRQKLLWMNGEYLRRMTPEAILDAATPFLVKAGLPVDSAHRPYLLQLIAAEREKFKLLTDVPARLDHFLMADDAFPIQDAAAAKWLADPRYRAILSETAELLRTAEKFDTSSLEKTIRDFCTRRGLTVGEVFHPLRVAVSGRTEGPGLFDLLALLGRERVLRRIARVLEKPHS